MLEVLEHFFGKANVFSGGNAPPAQLSNRFTQGSHQWQLHIWELTGAPESWEVQLDERLRREPVFAVISGIGGRTWAPVHRFCERTGLPCLFPNVDLPVVAELDFYDVYLSKGVLIEAQLIAEWLQRLRDAGGRAHPERQRVVQIVRGGDIGEAAAAELRRALPSHAFELVDRVLEPGSDATRLQEALSASGPGDALILWLRPGDLASLPTQLPAVFGLSGHGRDSQHDGRGSGSRPSGRDAGDAPGHTPAERLLPAGRAGRRTALRLEGRFPGALCWSGWDAPGRRR